jgi:hypothetical protein
MIASASCIDFRRPTELSHGDDQGLVEQAALAQILDQGACGLIERRYQTHPNFRTGKPIAQWNNHVLMRIPSGLHHRHKRDALLDQPAR